MSCSMIDKNNENINHSNDIKSFKRLNSKYDDIVYVSLNDIPDTLKQTTVYKILSEKHEKYSKIPFYRHIYEREMVISNFINISYSLYN